jgi:pimeloyl-ACP methyl ester carboxylesterase
VRPQYINVDTWDGKISLVRSNPKKSTNTILLVSGLGGFKEYWAPLFDQPALEGYDLVAVDLPGQGKSIFGKDYSYDVMNQAKAVMEALDYIDVSQIFGVFHTTSGSVGIAMNSIKKGYLRKFFGIETTFNLEPRSTIGKIISYNENGFQGVWNSMISDLRSINIKDYPSKNPKDLRDLIRLMVLSAENTPYYAVWRFSKSFYDFMKKELSQNLKSLEGVEKWYLAGQRDFNEIQPISKILEQLRFSVEFVRKSGDMMMFENPADFSRLLTKLISEKNELVQ